MCLYKTTAVHFVISTRCPLICPSGRDCNRKKSILWGFLVKKKKKKRLLLLHKSVFLSRGKKNQLWQKTTFLETCAHKGLRTLQLGLLFLLLIVRRIKHSHWMDARRWINGTSSMCRPALFYTQFPSLSPLLHESAKRWQRQHWEIRQSELPLITRQRRRKFWQLAVWHFAFPSLS